MLSVGGVESLDMSAGHMEFAEENHQNNIDLIDHEEDLDNVTDREGVSCSVGGGGGTQPTFNHPQNIHYLRHGLEDQKSSSDDDERGRGYLTGCWQENGTDNSDSDGTGALKHE